MAIDIRISAVAGIERAHIQADSIALIVGRNGAGKSSIAQAVACGLVGEPRIRGINTVSRLNAVVRSGFERGHVKISGKDGWRSLRWPEGKVKSEGKPPTSSAIGAGITKLTALSTAERSRFLALRLGAEPTKDELAKALQGLSFGEVSIDKLWASLNADGWDTTHKRAREAGTKLKGQWEFVTKDRFGSTKAAAWRPQDWSDDLEGKSLDGLKADLTTAREALESKIGTAALSSEKAAELEKWAGHLDKFEADLGKYEAELADLEKAYDKAWKARDGLPGVSADGLPCPHGCEKRQIGIVRNGPEITLRAVTPEKLTEAEKKKRRMEIAKADGALARAASDIEEKKAVVQRTKQGIERAIEAKAELGKSGSTGTSAEAVDQAREKLRAAEAHLRAFEAKTEADSLSTRIQRNQSIIDMLAPDGLRKTKLDKVLSEFNDGLEVYTSPFGLPPVTLDEDLDARMGDRSYALLSAGEQFALDAVLQVAIAKLDGSAAVVIDGAEVLVGPRRSGLLKMIAAAGIKAVVCVALRGPDLAPDLARTGHGGTWWVEDGFVTPLGDLAETRAA